MMSDLPDIVVPPDQMQPSIVSSPSLNQLQQAADWLATHCLENLEVQFALNCYIQRGIVPQATGEFAAIAFTQGEICGVAIAKPGNAAVTLESRDRTTALVLFARIQSNGCPQRVATSKQVKDWIHPLLLQHYSLWREYDQLVMSCTQAPTGGAGRWATWQDRHWLQAYEEAYLAERGSGNLNRDWASLIQRRRVAVLEHDGRIVSVVRREDTAQDALVMAPFTFPEYRRQGFAHQLLAFFVSELLQERPAVQLWVDEDNVRAIALYCSLGFQQIGQCYTGYFKGKG